MRTNSVYIQWAAFLLTLVAAQASHGSQGLTVSSHIHCVCQQDGAIAYTSQTLEACTCPYALELKQRIDELLAEDAAATANPEQWFHLLMPLVRKTDEQVLILDADGNRQLLEGTRSLCSCVGSNLWTGSCGFSTDWRLKFMILQAVGWSPERIRSYYAAQLNVDPQQTIFHQRSSGFLYGIVLLGILGLLVVVYLFRRWVASGDESPSPPPSSLPRSDKARLLEELDRIE